MKLKLLWLCVFVVGISIYSCNENIVSTCQYGENENPPATFTWIQNTVLTPNCVGCHGNVSPQGGLDLSAGNSYQNLVGQRATATALNRVEAGDSQNSYLMHRLDGSNGQSTMPPAGKLNQALIDSVAAWINRGALNN